MIEFNYRRIRSKPTRSDQISPKSILLPFLIPSQILSDLAIQISGCYCLTDLSLLADHLSNEGKSHRSQTRPRPSTFPSSSPWKRDSSLQEEQREREDPEIGEIVATSGLIDEGRSWSRQNPSYPSCVHRLLRNRKAVSGSARLLRRRRGRGNLCGPSFLD